MKGMVYNLDEASERINTETFNIFNLTPRLLCEWGRTNHPETNEPYITVRVAFSGNASHSSKGDITIPHGHYFEVMPHTLFGFEETPSINISQLWDGADVLFIDPPKVTTISDLRVFVDDVVSFINACKPLLADSRQRKLLIQGLRDYPHNQAKSAANLQAVNRPDTVSDVSEWGEPPGIKTGMITITKLAITAAWNIECEMGRKASAKDVIERLRKWVAGNLHPELIEITTHGVKWMTTAPDEKTYDIDACRATLKAWNKGRA